MKLNFINNQLAWYNNPLWQVLILAVCAVIMVFPNLGVNDIYNWDEAHYAENAREMVEHRDFLNIKYDHVADTANLKFPLGVWLMAVDIQLFGPSEVAIRFWSALFFVLTVIVTYFLGKELKNKYIGILAALILITSPQLLFWHSGSSGDLDSGLLFFTSLSVLVLLRSYNRESIKLFYWGVLFSTLAVFYKNLLGFFPLVIFFIFVVFSQRRKFYLKWSVVLRSLGIMAIILWPWLILRGPDFARQMISYDYFGRLLWPLEQHQEPFWFYLSELQKVFYPWFYFIWLGVAVIIRDLVFTRERRLIFPLIWFGFIVGLFSVAQTKLVWYILPAYPAMALIIAEFFWDFWHYHRETWSSTRRIWWRVMVAIFLLVIFMAALKNTQNFRWAFRVRDNFIEFLREPVVSKELGLANKINMIGVLNSPSHFFYLRSINHENQLSFGDQINCLASSSERAIVSSDYFNSFMVKCSSTQLILEKNNYYLIK